MTYANYVTGYRRYRQTAEGLILQVNFSFWCADSMCWRNDWRDADVHDVMAIELVK